MRAQVLAAAGAMNSNAKPWVQGVTAELTFGGATLGDACNAGWKRRSVLRGLRSKVALPRWSLGVVRGLWGGSRLLKVAKKARTM